MYGSFAVPSLLNAPYSSHVTQSRTQLKLKSLMFPRSLANASPSMLPNAK